MTQFKPTPAPVSVLFVCMGNICRSPTAHGVFLHHLAQAGLSEHVYVDSAGTHSYHVGAPPDARSQACALKRGIDLNPLRARAVETSDFEVFDYILAMDKANYDNLLADCPPKHHGKIQLFLNYAPHHQTAEVPDPYYGGERGFDEVFDLVKAASDGLLAHIRQAHLL